MLLVSRLSFDTRKKISSSSLPRPYQVHMQKEIWDIEEAKLDEAWDLNAAEDAPTECLSEHEEENDGSEYKVLQDRKLQ
jgi:hypothetical protein